MDNDFYVYLHRRNDTRTIFYVGKGRGRRAFLRHGRSELWTRIAKKYGWSAEIIKDGLTEAEAFNLEVETIAGISGLCNFTSGGEGISGYTHTEESKAAMSLYRKGKAQDPIHIEARTIKLRGRKRTPEFGEAVRQRLLGRVASIETREKMSKAKTGKIRPPEVVLKTSQWHMGKKRSEESRKAMSAASAVKRSILCKSNGMLHDSLESAAKWMAVNGYPKATRTGIWFSASGKRKLSYGLEWAYA